MSIKRIGVHLRVVDVEVSCPYRDQRRAFDGLGGGTTGSGRLGDCYVNSAASGHFCSNPTGTGRCSSVRKFKKRYGWRSWYLKPVKAIFWLDRPSQHYPFQLVALPLDEEGTRWFAVNVYGGQRKEIDLDNDARPPELNQRFLMTLDGAVMPGVGPTSECGKELGWNAPDRETWITHAIVEQERRKRMASDFIVNGRGAMSDDQIKQIDKDRPRRAEDVPSAGATIGGILIGDPSCEKCQKPGEAIFGGCPEHRYLTRQRQQAQQKQQKQNRYFSGTPSTKEWRAKQAPAPSVQTTPRKAQPAAPPPEKSKKTVVQTAGSILSAELRKVASRKKAP